MILIQIDKDMETYSLFDTSNDNEWEYEGKYRQHYIDEKGVMHIKFDKGMLELPAGCCVINITN